MVAPEQHTPAQAASWELSRELIDEVKRADTILLGLPLYNFGAAEHGQGLGRPSRRTGALA